MTLEDRETIDFPIFPFSPRPKWFSGDHGPQRREAVFPFRERSHSVSSMWRWGQEENHPFCMLTSMNVGGCDIYLHHWISQGKSMDQISRVGLQTLLVNGEQLIIAIWSTVVRSIKAVQRLRLKRKARFGGKRVSWGTRGLTCRQSNQAQEIQRIYCLYM